MLTPRLGTFFPIGIAGTKTTNDVVTITFYDAALAGGYKIINYTVQAGDTLNSIATALTTAINADTGLQGIGVSATSAASTVLIKSNSPSGTYALGSTSAGATEAIVYPPQQNGVQMAAIGGTVTTSDALTITVYDAALSGGSKAITYTVPGGATTTSIATGFATAINADTALQAIGVSATSTANIVNIKSVSVHFTTYAQSKSAGATETITLGLGTSVTQYGHNKVNALNVMASGAGGCRFSANTNKGMQSATLASTVISVTSTSANATTYSQSTSGGATETITLGTNMNGNILASIGGTKTTGDTLTLTVINSGLSGGQKSVNYTVQSGDNLVTIASGLAAAVNGDSAIAAIGVKAASSVAATLYSSTIFFGNSQLYTGTNTAVASSVDGGSNTNSETLQLSVTAGSSTTLTYDADGNMTSDGTNSYLWDAENRLVQITYPGSGNNSQLVYDGLDRCVKIEERTNSSVTSTKQFVWCGSERCEERDASSAVTKQFFAMGQRNSSTNYFYNTDHLGSVREMTDSSGVIQAQYNYDPYGQVTKLQGSQDADFQYAGYYLHARSGLNLTLYRAYNSGLGRWISRDPIEEVGGINLYAYVGNNPTNIIDPTGLYYGVVPMEDTLQPSPTGAPCEGDEDDEDQTLIAGDPRAELIKYGIKSGIDFAIKFSKQFATRRQALRQIKRDYNIRQSAQPVKITSPRTDAGKGIVDDRNVKQMEYINERGKSIIIRQDKPVTYPEGPPQGPHFNVGPKGSDLKGHYYYQGK